MTTRKEIEDTRSEGGAEALAMMARKLGYAEKWGQLQFNNGATATDLFAFFDDNPGAVEAVVNWVLEEGCTRDGEQLEEDEEEGDEGEACPGCGALPGDGLTEGCEDPGGCGELRKQENAVKVDPDQG